MPILALEHVSRVFARERCVAVNDITLSIARNEYAAITGPSGSGKSTLLNLMCGIDRPTAGRVLFDGRPMVEPREWTRARARRIGFVFQSFNLLPTLTAEQNVEVAMLGGGLGARERRRRSSELLARVGLADRARHRPTEMSGGEKQRLAIARAMANAPDVILADEPTGNLDSATAGEIVELLGQVRAQSGATLVIVTHDPQIAERASRAIAIKDGRIASA